MDVLSEFCFSQALTCEMHRKLQYFPIESPAKVETLTEPSSTQGYSDANNLSKSTNVKILIHFM